APSADVPGGSARIIPDGHGRRGTHAHRTRSADGTCRGFAGVCDPLSAGGRYPDASAASAMHRGSVRPPGQGWRWERSEPLRPLLQPPTLHGGADGSSSVRESIVSGTTDPKTPTPSPTTLESRTGPDGLKRPPRT